MLYDSQIPSDLYSFSHHRNSARLDVGRMDALRNSSLSKRGFWGKVNEVMTPQDSSSEDSEDSELEESKETEGSERPITEGDARGKTGLQRMGMGLPLSNIYATYFGGSLDIISLDGWGTFTNFYFVVAGTNSCFRDRCVFEATTVRNKLRRPRSLNRSEVHVISTPYFSLHNAP